MNDEYQGVLGRALLASKGDAIIAADANGKIVFWNPGAERIFGHPPASALGESLDIIIPERLRGRHWEGYHRVMDGAPSRYADGQLLAVPAIRNDGTSISIEFTLVPLHDPAGKLTGLAAIVRDVTERFEEMRKLRKELAAALAPNQPGNPPRSSQ